MTDLKQKRLASLNKLLMEQDRPKYAAAFEAENDKIQQIAKDNSIGSADLIKLYLGGKITKEVLRYLAKAKGIELGGLVSIAARFGAAIQLIIAAAVGLAAGYGLNRFLTNRFEGEALERINRAIKDPKYGLAELQVYCRSSGPLCGENGGPVKCLEPKERSRIGGGGYQYERGSSIGLGDGRERSSAASRAFDKLGTKAAREFGMVGAAAAAGLSIAGGPGGMVDKIITKFSGDSGVLEVYEQTPGYDSRDIAVVAGIANALISKDILDKKIKYDPEKRKLEMDSDALISPYKDCISALLTSQMAEKTLGRFQFLKSNFDVVSAAFGLKTFEDYSKDIKKAKAASTAGSKKAAAGGQKCDALPLEPGCEGRAVRNILAVLIRATESGQKYMQNNEEEVGRVYNTAIYNDQWLKIVSNILGNGTDEEKQLLNNFLKTKSIRKYRDPLMLYIDKIAKEKLNLTESLKRSKIPLYNSPVHPLYEQRLRTLNKKLMEK